MAQVWADDLWALDVWQDGVWAETAADVTGVATHDNAAQVHTANAEFATVATAVHNNAAQVHGGSGFFSESGLPAAVVQNILGIIDDGFETSVGGLGRGLDASQILLFPTVVNSILVGASLEDVDNILDLIRTHMVGGIAEFAFNSSDVTRVSDADAHQIKVWMEVVRLLEPFSSNP